MEDSDVFQCGKCKKQFLSIEVFMSHKAECNKTSVTAVSDQSRASSNICGIPSNTILVQKIQIPSSTISNYPQNIVLSEADLLQLTTSAIDPSTSSNVQQSSIQAQSFQTIEKYPNQHQWPNNIIVHNVGGQTNEQQTLDLPFNLKELVSRTIFVTTQQPNGSVVLNLSTGTTDAAETVQTLTDAPMLLNLANVTEAEHLNPQSVILNIGTDQSINCASEAEKTVTSSEQEMRESRNEKDQEHSTVNIITEFHSSMVKSRKDPNTVDGDDNQARKDSKLNCAYCAKTFTKNFDLIQHIRCHTGEKPFQCVVCGRAFAQKSNVKKHMATHKVWPGGLSTTLPYLVSQSSSSSLDEGKSQENNSSSDVPDNSNESEQEKSSSSEVDKSYACCYCSYIGNSYCKLKSHMKEHDTEKVYKCVVKDCCKMFNELDPFLEHTRSHDKEMSYRCHDCSRSFSSLHELGTHQFTHSLYPNSSPKPIKRYYQCKLCLNKYKSSTALDHHIDTTNHSYVCHHCKKTFPCERYLRRHLLIHSEKHSYICKVCEKGFKTESYLKVHMIVHSEEKPFKCSICKAAFNRKDKLKRHNLIHDPDKRYKCPFQAHSGCTKEFSRPDKLKAHILTHGSRPYKCKKCGNTYKRKAVLREHYKQAHDENMGLKQLTEETEDNNNSGLSFSDSEDSRSIGLRRKKKRSVLLNGKFKKEIYFGDEDDLDSNSEMVDDIPTAHIEIIAAHSIVSNSDLTSMSLSSEMGYEDLQFDATEEEMNIPVSSPISEVEAIHSNNSNSLLSADIQSSDIADYS